MVEVKDNKVVEHITPEGGPCLSSGMKYVSRKIASYPGGPKQEVLAEGNVPCPFGGDHTHFVQLIEETTPNPLWN